MSKPLTEVMGNSIASFFQSSEVQRNVSRIACKCFKSMGGGSGGLTSVSTNNSSTVIFSGDGTSSNPLSADIDLSDINTLYTANGTIFGTRVVTLPTNQSLTFNNSSNSSFAVTLGNSVNFSASNLSGSTILLSATSGTNYLNIGSTGTKLASPLASLDLSFSGGLKLLQGDDNTATYSRFLMAPGTSSPSTWNSTSPTGGSSIFVQAISQEVTDGVVANSSLLSSGYIMSSRLTPTRFYINRFTNSGNINTKLFEVNQDGSIYLSSVLNAPSLTTDGTGKIQAGTAKADINSPSFIGSPTAPTFPSSTNNSQIATTAFAHSLLPTNGVVTLTADGGTNVFPVPHNLGVRPNSVNILAANAAASSLNYFVDDTANTTNNFFIAFPTAPPAGSLMFYWQAFKF